MHCNENGKSVLCISKEYVHGDWTLKASCELLKLPFLNQENWKELESATFCTI